MNTTYPPSTMVQSNSIRDFKTGVDELLAKRSYFISQVLPKLIEGQDYYVIKGRKSLAKGGSEKIASIYGYTASFKQDNEVIKSFDGVKNIIAFVCDLYKGNQKVGQGRGASTLAKNDNDPNKTIKMSQKSAYIDAVIRTSGLSDIFTQDLEVMPISAITETSEQEEDTHRPLTVKDMRNLITDRQKSFLESLITEKMATEEKQKWLSVLPQLSRISASDMISSFLMETR